MRKSLQRSRYESRLAVAHRALYGAQQAAVELGDDGAVEDLSELSRHLAVMLEDSLKDHKRPRRQLSVLDNDRTYL